MLGEIKDRRGKFPVSFVKEKSDKRASLLLVNISTDDVKKIMQQDEERLKKKSSNKTSDVPFIQPIDEFTKLYSDERDTKIRQCSMLNGMLTNVNNHIAAASGAVDEDVEELVRQARHFIKTKVPTLTECLESIARYSTMITSHCMYRIV